MICLLINSVSVLGEGSHLIFHSIVTYAKAIGVTLTSSGACLTPLPLRCPISKLPEIEAGTVQYILLKQVQRGGASRRPASLVPVYIRCTSGAGNVDTDDIINSNCISAGKTLVARFNSKLSTKRMEVCLPCPSPE